MLINLIFQVVLGVALEFRNRWYRIFTVYAAGVIAGSLVTSITDPTVYLAGASGGVYALLTAHLANLILVSCLIIHHLNEKIKKKCVSLIICFTELA